MEQGPQAAERRIAIVGGADSRRYAPYDDPSWEIWAFSSLRLRTPRITRWFEMHAMGDLRSQLRRQTARRYDFVNYMRFLQSLDCPVYMQRVYPSIPCSVAYPLDEALHQFGRPFTSTASYLIALAMMEGVSQLGVWGIHLTHRTVYARQRPGVEYLLGLARERGIELHVPASSPLKIPDQPKRVQTSILYGYDWRHPGAWWRPGRTRLKTRRRRRKLRTTKRR